MGDFLAVGTLAWKVYRSCKATSRCQLVDMNPNFPAYSPLDYGIEASPSTFDCPESRVLWQLACTSYNGSGAGLSVL